MRKIHKNAIALTAAMGILPVGVDATIVNVGLIPISKALNTDFNTIQWISVGYLLANAAVIAISGYLGNRLGVKRLFIVGLATFGLFSFLCGIAPDIGWLIAFRVLQGLGGGALIPLGMAIALEPFPKEDRIKAMALVGLPIMLGPIIAPILGGLIIDNLSWSYIFLVNVPICLVAVLLAIYYIPADQKKAKGQNRFDFAGLILSTVGVVAVVYAFKLVGTRNPDSVSALNPSGDLYGWGYWQVWAFLVAGLALLVVFGVQALFFSKDPVLDLRLFTNREFLTSNLVNWVFSVIMFGVMALIPQFLQQVRIPGLSAIDTGLALLPMGIATFAGMILSRVLYPILGARPLCVASGLITALAFWWLSSLTPTTSGGDLWLQMTLLGLCVSISLGSVTTLATSALTGEKLNKASSLFQSTKLIFGAIGSSMLVTILVQQSINYSGTVREQLLKALPGGQAALTTSEQISQFRQQVAARAGTNAINDIFSILVWVAVGMAVIALALPGRTEPTPQAESVEEPVMVAG